MPEPRDGRFGASQQTPVEYVDDLLHLLVDEGQATLKRLGFRGTVAVNIEWTDDPSSGYFCIGSKIPDEATSLLAASLRASASNINEEDEGVNGRSVCPTCGRELSSGVGFPWGALLATLCVAVVGGFFLVWAWLYG